jgi:hypothetical protein
MPYPKTITIVRKTVGGAGSLAQGVEHLPYKGKPLSSNPITSKEERKERREERRKERKIQLGLKPHSG